MTVYSVPYTFVPGTKAKATEVNANFSKVIDLIEETNQNSLNVDLSNLSNAGKNVIYSNSAPSKLIGEIITSTTPLNDAGLHLLDGSTISAGGSYDAFVDFIADLYNSGNYTSLFDTEENWQAAVTENGICGKFVYTAAAGDNPATVRLPKYNFKLYTGGGNAPVKGNGKPMNYTDGTDNMYQYNSFSGIANVRKSTGTEAIGDTAAASATPSGNKVMGLVTDAQYSGLMTDLTNITTNLDCFYYIVIATTAKTEIQVDIDEIATDLNGKADKDLSNVSNTSGFRKLAEVYNNGASWYKIYNEYNPSTGDYIGQWCEQGSSETIVSTLTSTAKTRTFLKAFKDTNYTVILSLQANSTNVGAGYFSVNSKSTASFTTAYTASCAWVACGYIN